MNGFDLINTLSDGITTVDLSNDIKWSDEFTWSPNAMQTEYTLTGALVVEQSTKLAGRPITLESIDNAGWLPRGTIEQITAWRDAGKQLALTYRGVTRQVLLVADDAITATPVFYFSDPVPGDWYQLTLKLIEATL